MPETTYKTAEAAAQLSISQYHMRRLITVGLVDADQTEGGHWRIPHREVERLKKEGVPPIPARVEKTTARSHENPATSPASASAAAAPTPASPEVREAADQVTITRSHLERRKTELELEEIEDRFEERERKRREQEAEQFRREDELQRQVARRSWEETTLESALRALPFDCDAETRLDVEVKVRAALKSYDQTSAPNLVKRIAAAAVDAALVKYHQRKEVESIIEEAFRQLPSGARGTSRQRSEWELKILSQLQTTLQASPSVDTATLRTIALATARSVGSEYEQQRQAELLEVEHKRLKDSILQHLLFWMLGEANDEERTTARNRAAEALEEFDPGATHREMDEAIKAALKPLERQVRQRKENDAAEHAIEAAVSQGKQHLKRVLSRDYEWDSYLDREAAFDEYAPQMADRLRELLEVGNIEPGEVNEWVERWAENNIEEDEE